MQDDRRLVKRIQLGDRLAFEEFLDSFGGKVHGLVRRFINNPTDAEDVTQEIFCEIYRSIGGFRGDSALSTWVYRVAVNCCLKHRQRARSENLPFDEQMHRSTGDWRSDPEQSAVRQELAAQVQKALNGLSPLHSDVVVLCELHGLTYQECASVLQIPVGTVKSRLSNAFRRLRVSLSGYVSGEAGAPRCSALGDKI